MNKTKQFMGFLMRKEPIATIRDICTSIYYVFKWLPVIWKDRQWDYVFLLIILRHKLKMMRDFFNKDAMYVGAEKDAKDMDLCIKLVNRLINDDYLINVFKHHEKKWGELQMKSVPYEEDPRLHKLEFSVPNVKTESDDKKERIQRNFLHNLEEKQKKQDLELLTKLLNKHLFKWWD